MKRLQRFSNMRPEDAENEDWYWNRDSLEEETTCHAKRTDYRASKSKAKTRKIQDRLDQDVETDNSIED